MKLLPCLLLTLALPTAAETVGPWNLDALKQVPEMRWIQRGQAV